MVNFFKFILSCQENYNPALYHNRVHASDVVQLVYLSIKQERELSSAVTPAEYFALITAALCHDLGHSGVDNQFIHSKLTLLHKIYPDVGPLEMAHAALSFQKILQYNFYHEDLRLLRIRFLEFVLSTDMTFHFAFIEKMNMLNPSIIKRYYRWNGQDDPVMNKIFEVLKWIRLKSIIKMADISNPCRPQPQAEYWAFAYVDENRAIGDLGGIKTEVHDHSKKSVVKCQIGFINYVLKPFMDGFAKTWGAAIDM